MSSVDKRIRDGRTTWLARWRGPDGRQRKRTFVRKIDADRYLQTIGAAMQTSTYLDPDAGNVSVGQFAVKWLSAQGHLAPSTQATYQSILGKHVLPRWGSTPLSRVAHEDVAGWVSDLVGAGLAPATVRYVFRVFSLLLELAVKASKIPRNPAAGVRLPKVQTAEKRFLSHQEVAALGEAAGDYRVAVLLMSYCGLRWGELAGLKVGRVDLMRRRVNLVEAVSEVRGKLIWGPLKAHQIRSVPLPRFLVDDLALIMVGKAPGDVVFTTRRGAVMRNLNFRRDVFDRAATDAGLAGLTPHELRHTGASLAVSAGANVKVVQRMLGHASAAMTLDVYSGLFDEDLDAVAVRLDEAAAIARVPRVCPEAAVADLTERLTAG